MKGRRYVTSATVAAIALAWIVGCEREATKPTAESEPAREESGAESEKGGTDDKKQPTESTPKTLDELPEGVNAVQHEMRRLNTAMGNILTLIANDQLDAIPGQLADVHPARKLTRKAIAAGEYEPPSNPDKLGEFKKLDAAFHQDLKRLRDAAQNGNLRGATDAYTELVSGCTECHTRFRFE